MNTSRNLKTLAPVTFVAAILALTLSGCGLQLVDAEPTAPAEESSPSTSTPPADSEVNENPADGNCDGKDIVLSNDQAAAVLTGTCGNVIVSGDGISAVLDNAESVTVTGQNSSITVKNVATTVTLDSGSSGVIIEGASAAGVIIDGSTSSVVFTNIGSATITGSNNIVTWSEGARSASDTGTGNTVVPAS